MFDLVVRGGSVVTRAGVFVGDLGITAGRLAAIAAPGTLVADEVFDGHGLHVLPGVIDGHVHFREPGLEHKEDFLSGSRAAVMGGVTTVLEMPNTVPPTSTAAEVERKRAVAEAKSYCDFGLFGLLGQDNLDHLRPMAGAGVIGFKCFLGQSTGDIPPPDDGVLLDALALSAALGLRVAFHAENDAIIRRRSATVRAAGRSDVLAHLEARPAVAEAEAIQRVGLLAHQTRARVHILHLSSREGLAAVEFWRGQGVDITCEVTPHHCFLTSEDAVRLGSVARINPPIRDPGHAAALLDALARGRIDSVATDHAPHTADEKLHADIWHALSGFAGVETSLRLFLTYGGLSLPQLVRATSEEPARIWGLAPRKGRIQVGSDADLTVVDLAREETIEENHLHGKNNLSPWLGRRTRGLPVATILRGRIIMRDGALCGSPTGRMLLARQG
jgi:dihydroorotase